MFWALFWWFRTYLTSLHYLDCDSTMPAKIESYLNEGKGHCTAVYLKLNRNVFINSKETAAN